MLVTVLVLCLSVLLAGCTTGQMAPAKIKDLVYAAQADAQVVSERVGSVIAPSLNPTDAEWAAFYKVQRDDCLACLLRISGTKADSWESGFLSPVVHWLKGTRPPKPGGGQ